ncbi:MAG: hypothetical protein JXA46_11535 [Dehalococcoidales bacterium]|nr:hypothetical protein [Dehalococcoidales bacterium]
MKEELLSTKFHVPSCFPGMVYRPRLQALLQSGLNGRLLLISAPAGFGKTSLLSEWLADCRGITAWISLDKGDNDPAKFLRYLIASLQPAGPIAVKMSDALLSPSQSGVPDIEPLLTLLLNELAGITERILIVLDDYHLIENRDIHGAVSFLIENAPSRVHVVVSTRSDPPLPLARWRARGQMVEIRGDNLRFTSGETKALFTHFNGPELSENDIDFLAEKTEGWAAGLRMALLSMQGRNDPSEFVRTFSGSHRYIMDYLLEEVLHRQTDEIQAFLLQTAILERLHGDLCGAVTGQTGGRQKLAMLEKANMFVLPLDDQRQWYRYHHLFADLLQARLREQYPAMLNTFHIRASRWYEDNGMIAGAISHALAAADYERAAYLLEKETIPLITRGELSTLLDWSEKIPHSIIGTRPRLCVDLSWAFIFAGRTPDAESLLEKAVSRINRDNLAGIEGDVTAGVTGDRPDGETRDILGNVAAQRAFIADMCGDAAGAIEQAAKADVLVARTDSLIRSVIPFVFARAYRLDGEMGKATEKLYEVAEFARAAGNIMTLSTASYELAALWKIEGRLRKAAELYEDTLKLAGEKNARYFGSVAKLDAGMSDLLREWNQLEAALPKAAGAIERMKTWNYPSDLVIACIMLSRVRKACGDLDGSEATLEKAEHVKRNSILFAPLGTMLETERVKLWIARGNLAAAGRWMEECQQSSTGPLLLRELEHIAVSRIYLAQGNPAKARDILTDLAEAAGQGGRFGTLIEVLVLLALAFKAENDESGALTALEKALRLAEPEGYIRVFVDEALPMAEMLFTFKHRRQKEADVRSVGKDYISTLLAAFPGTSSAGRKGIVEDLSERELEVLRLAASGMTNKQIAAELFITAGTVKAHTASIYRKLDADNRSRAIALARELKLI